MLAYNSLLDNSGILKYTKLQNLLDKLTNNNFSAQKEADLWQLEAKLMVGDEAFLSDEYLKFLLLLCNNILEKKVPELDKDSFTSMRVSKESLINLSKNFYASLHDKEILDLANKLFNDESSINFSNVARRGMADCSGLTFNDYVFDKTYINVTRQNNIFDYQVFNHEIMHGIDFYMKQKVPSENYYGFHEVPTYTIDYLFIDFLEKIGFLAREVQILKKQLLEIQSGVMAYGLKEQIKANKEKGILHLKEFMKSIIPKNQTPDFAYIGLTNDKLLQYSKHIGDYSLQNENNMNIRGKNN